MSIPALQLHVGGRTSPPNHVRKSGLLVREKFAMHLQDKNLGKVLLSEATGREDSPNGIHGLL